MLDLSEQLRADLNPAAVCNAWSESLTVETQVAVDESDTELEVCVLHLSSSSYDMHVSSSSFEAPVAVDESDTELEVCVFITAGPMITLCAGVGPVRTPVLQHRVRLFSRVSLVWESNPKLQGGWCKTQPPGR